MLVDMSLQSLLRAINVRRGQPAIAVRICAQQARFAV